MAEPTNQEVKSKRDAMRERLSSRYPDLNMDDDEAVAGRISEDYDEYDRQLNDYKGREEALTNMFNADPRSANFIANWHNGSDPAVELMRQFGDAFKEALNDPAKLDELEAARKEYLDRVAKSQELDAEYEKNIGSSIETFDRFQIENGLSDEQADRVVDFLNGIFHDAIKGIYTRESMEMALNAINHDADVAAAADDAEVRGRNAKINETLRRRQEGDGVAPLGGSAGKVEEPKRRMNIFDYAEAAK